MTAKLVGHSAYCLRDLWAKVVAEDDVEVVYLTDIKMRQLLKTLNNQLLNKVGLESERFKERSEEDQRFHRALKKAHDEIMKNPSPHIERGHRTLMDNVLMTTRWLTNGLLKLRPSEMGPVGKAYWTYDGVAVGMGHMLEQHPEHKFLI